MRREAEIVLTFPSGAASDPNRKSPDERVTYYLISI